MKQDALMVNNSAIKTNNDLSYVEVPNETVNLEKSTNNSSGIVLKNSPKQQVVEIGIANDTDTEIVSGLNEGDRIILRTVNNNTTSSTNTSSTERRSGATFFGGGGPMMR